MNLIYKGLLALNLDFGGGRLLPLTRQAAREAANFISAQAQKTKLAGEGVVAIDITHEGRLIEWRGTVEDAERLVERIEAVLANGQPLKKIDTITRDEKGEIAKVESTFVY